MKLTTPLLSFLILVLVVPPSLGGVLSWLEQDLQENGELPQADQPHSDEDDSQEKDTVSSLVSSLHNSILELTGRRSSWFDRYDSLADKAKDNNDKIQELSAISQKVMPIIWKNWLGTIMWKESVYEQMGLLHRIPVDTSVSRPHPLYELNTNLTANDQFTFEITMKMKKRANIGLRLMWIPDDGAPYSWDDNDILYSAHFRWVYPNRSWGKEKQVVFNTKQDGTWGEDGAVFDEWPDFQVGQKFKLQITTNGNADNKCFNMRLYLGHERFHLVPSKPAFNYVFCLPSYAQHFLRDPRHLKLILNEDIMYDLTDAYDIYEVMYMPEVLQFSPGQM